MRGGQSGTQTFFLKSVTYRPTLINLANSGGDQLKKTPCIFTGKYLHWSKMHFIIMNMWCAGFDPSSVACYEDLQQYAVRTESGYECFCGFSLRRKDNVLRHIESKHFPNHFAWNCDICGKQVGTKKALEMHKSYSHTKQTWFDCIMLSIRFRLNKNYLWTGDSMAWNNSFLFRFEVAFDRLSATHLVHSQDLHITCTMAWSRNELSKCDTVATATIEGFFGPPTAISLVRIIVRRWSRQSFW